MSFSPEIKEKVKRFAKEQSHYYLDEAEMTYMEKLRRKTDETKNKLSRRLAKLKGRSVTSLEAQNDMILYMSDYINDLIAEGLSEEEAFERAKEELKFRSETARSNDLQERFAEYYKNREPADYEAIGLFYGGFIFLGMTIGGIVGFFGSGGREMFLTGGWVDTLIGIGIGMFIGVGVGMISNAVFVLKEKR